MLRISLPLLFLASILLAPSGCGPRAPELPEGVLAIGVVQGTGDRSPLEGQEVTVQGIVTARFPGRDGFFLQSAPGEEDRNPGTSDGIFVELPEEGAGALTPGDRVRVTGRVVELGSSGRTLTTIQARSVEASDPRRSEGRAPSDAAGAPLLPPPVSVTAPPESADDWERLEGMRVRVEAPLTLSGQFGLRRFGEVVTSFGGRLFQPTELHRPGPAADSALTANAARTLVLDDGSEVQWPDALNWRSGSSGGWPTDEDPFRAGSVLAPVTGIVDVRRGGYLLLPVEPVRVAEAAGRPPPPPSPTAGETDGLHLRVGVVNVENLFNGDGAGGGFPTPRGARTPEGWELQQAKLVATLQVLEVDVVALSEVENDGVGPRTALRHFVDALNATGPHRDWVAIETEGPGSDAIRTALLYRSSRVAPLGEPVVPAAAIFQWGSRPPLGHAFQRLDEGVPRGEPWLVVSNHLKSKGGCPEADDPRAAPGDRDQGDGQGCWNAHRTEAARALARWLAGDPAGLGALSAWDGAPQGPEAARNALIVGDLNSYGREDPIRLLEAEGWVDAFSVRQDAPHPGNPPYSYVFQGQAGRLDHALLHETRRERLLGTFIWHANADEDPGFGYQAELERAQTEGRPPRATPWRSSDHDPLVVVVRVVP